MSSVYEINKGVNRSIEFKGLKAQYITYMAVGLVSLLVLFAVGYIAGVPVYLCLFVIGGGGFVLVSWVYKLSHKYGEHGLMKEAAHRQVPPAIICRSRKLFFERLINEAYGNREHDNRDGSPSGHSVAVKKPKAGRKTA